METKSHLDELEQRFLDRRNTKITLYIETLEKLKTLPVSQDVEVNIKIDQMEG